MKNNFASGEILFDTVAINSYQYTGSNALWINVNPLKHPRYQKEQEHFNNIARLAFKVNRDVTNPLLDVTFDGVRILNRDLVSAKPHIHVSLKDENKFLALNDTSAFQVHLKYPGQTGIKPVYFANDLQFTPASLPNNSCKIDYTPVLMNDGLYELTVQGKDRSANRSGSTEYKVQFEVKNKATVTQVMNYPNPFSTSTRFVFTLSGSEIPDVFTIQIMTVSGKVVREITKEELGNIRIGRNITEYAWDGKDDFGDKLGNGVYLYKVITRLNNKDIERFNTDADKYFVKEFGKMVIMR
jgi:flagellar hook assembly protein FlgD